MLINLSNHPQTNWSEKQLKAANNQFGDIVDVQFPNIEPSATSQEVHTLAREYFLHCMEIAKGYNISPKYMIIHIMGEMTFLVAFYKANLAFANATMIASTTERIKEKVKNADGTTSIKTTFNFCGFREY